MTSRATSDRDPVSGGAGGADGEDVARWLQIVAAEVSAALQAIAVEQVAALEGAILQARRVYLAGQGRSGLIARGFAQRLMHIGLESYAVGDIISPAVGPGDLLIAVTASGRTETTVRQAQKARAERATVAAVLEPRDSELIQSADLVLSIPTAAPTRSSAQHSTTLFCQVVQITFDVLCAMLQAQRGQSDAQLSARHSNLE
jgi:6-phospho-3-hexuloisomerase